jgi:hypothetical protein
MASQACARTTARLLRCVCRRPRWLPDRGLLRANLNVIGTRMNKADRRETSELQCKRQRWGLRTAV